MQSRTIPPNYYIRKLKLPWLVPLDILAVLSMVLLGLVFWMFLNRFVICSSGGDNPFSPPFDWRFISVIAAAMASSLWFEITLAVQCGRLCKDSRGFTVGLILSIAAAFENFPPLAVAYYLIYHRRHIVRLRRHLRLRFAEESDRYRL